MTDAPKPPGPRASPQQRASAERIERDQARIDAEIAGTDGGTDPFPAAVRATRMPMVITDPRRPDNPIVFVNDAFCRLTGYARAEIVGRNCRFLQGPATDPQDIARLREALAAPRAIEIDIRNYRRDGTPFWNRLLMAPVHDAGGALAYFFASQLDVTLERERLAALESENAVLTAERRSDRERLAFSEQSHQLATEAAEIGTWDLDIFTGVLTWSDRTKAMFGISPGVPCSMDDFYAGLHPDDREATVAAFASAIDPGERATYDVEYRTVGKEDGLVRWVAAKGRGMFDETGRCVRALGTAIDITARRRTDEALRSNEARLRFLDALGRETAQSLDADAILATTTRMVAQHLDLSNCAYADMDPDEDGFTIRGDWAREGSRSIVGRYSLAAFGTLAVRSLGAGEPLIVNDNLSELAPEEAATFQAIGIAATICMPLIKDGRLTALMAIHDSVPRVWTADDLNLIREVTERCWAHIERVRAVAALATLNATLEDQVTLRTGELMAAEEALRQSQKMEAVGQLTGGIAHDFNNMLAVVIGSLDLLGRRLGAGDERARRHLEAAADGARRAALLTQRLLAFSRQQPLDPEPIEANRLVAGMSELIRRSLGAAVTLETVLAGGLWRTHADPHQLENVILNLAVNARDAMPDGGRLTIETQNAHLDRRYTLGHPGVAPGQYVLVAVTDTGSGMPPEVIARAFDPFFTTKEVGRGTGLGLSQVYGFVRQSGGHVKIYSEPGQGTTVKVYLPRLTRAPSETVEEAEPADLPTGDRQALVLVVEDEPAVRRLSVDALEALDYRVLDADGAAAALRLLDAHPEIALLFTDVVMPEVDGRKLADEARRRRPDLKVLFTTGYTRNAVVHNGVLDPGVELIGKPFTLEELAGKVRQVLDGA